MPINQRITALFQASSQFHRGFIAALITALCAVVVLQVTPAQAQSADSTQTVSSRVLDTDGQGISGAQVVAEPMDSRFPAVRTTTDSAGRFTLTLVREVTYQITSSKAADGSRTYSTQTTYFRPRAAAGAPEMAAEPEAPAEEEMAETQQEWFLLVK